MPRIDIVVKDLEVSGPQLKALLKGRQPVTLTQDLELPFSSKALYHRGPLQKRDYAEAPVEDPRQYLRTPGTKKELRGRPHKLTEAGLKKIWDLHCEGFSNVEISNGFQKLIGPEAVRRLIKKIKETK